MQGSTPAGRISRAVTESEAAAAGRTACFLSTHAYVCEVDDGAIILDLRNNTYLGINAQHLHNIRDRIGNWPDSERREQEVGLNGICGSEDLIADLLNRGILTTSPTCRQASLAENPTMALTVASYSEPRRRIPLAHVAGFCIAFTATTWCFRRKRLPVLLDWLRRRQSSIHRTHTATREETQRRLASFLWLRTWCYTAQRRCLFDSLALSVYLTRGMVPCTFVIGVATKPFLAHSWVQFGESVLNDTAEHVQDFKPILSIGGK
jgi:hypothetical protein